MIKDKNITLSDIATRFTYTTLGRLVAFDTNTTPMVEVLDGKQSQTKPARSCIKLNANHLGQEVVLLILQDNTPVIMGAIESEPVMSEQPTSLNLSDNTHQHVVRIDGQVLNLQATESISLQCGKAKILLTKQGKITIKGLSLLSRAKKSNRIQGGSIGLN